MSGIMGVYYLSDRPVERVDLTRMVDVLVHRGPDSADIWVDGNIGFGHRMLWTTPESLLEKLPLFNQRGDLVITADARIDNRDELISALEFDHCLTEKITDSQLILAAYEKWDEQCPKHLLGDFAFAIWDRRKQSLFCARDHMGVKPFYYYHQPNKIFAFGSEIKALLCLQEIPRQLNETKVAEYLEVMLEDKSSTFYQGIFRLPPAHTLMLSPKQIQLKLYWSLDSSREIQLNSDEEYAEAFGEIFTQAVHCRLRTAFPIGSHLSGGLDSSLVTCVARQLLTQQGNSLLHTFSNVFDVVTQCDERSFIEAVLNQGGLIPHYVYGEQRGPLSDLEKVLWHHDEPFFAPTHFLAWSLNQAAQKLGVRIVLDGMDGDTTVSHGSGYFTELASKGQWSTFAAESQLIAQRLGSSPLSVVQNFGYPYIQKLVRQGQWLTFALSVQAIHDHFAIPKRKLLIDQGLKPLVPDPVRQIWQAIRGHRRLTSTNNSIINSKFSRRINFKQHIRDLNEYQEALPITERKQHWQNLVTGLMTSVIEIMDHHAAAFSLEIRHPFMDKRLIEFCLALPPEQKFNQGWSRLVMRRAMNKILPEDVQWRSTKANMSPSFVHGLLNINRQLLQEAIPKCLENVEEYIDSSRVQTIYEHIISNNKINPDDVITILQVVFLGMWMNQAQLK